jgi:hypothetical protein
LWEVLVPTVRRVGGKPYTTRFHRVWDAKVRAIAGGLTVLRPSVGYWTSPAGDIVRERMIPVRVACTEEQARAIGAMTLRYYDQEAVMLCRVSDKVVMVYGKEQS